MPSPATVPVIEVTACGIETAPYEVIDNGSTTSTRLQDALAFQLKNATVEERIDAPGGREVGVVGSTDTTV
jgi:hypothetical protein